MGSEEVAFALSEGRPSERSLDSATRRARKRRERENRVATLGMTTQSKRWAGLKPGPYMSNCSAALRLGLLGGRVWRVGLIGWLGGRLVCWFVRRGLGFVRGIGGGLVCW